MKLKSLVLFIFILLVVIGLYFSGYLTQTKELKAMLKSSVPTTPLTTGREVRRSIQDKGVTLGKPIRPYVVIDYEPKDNYTKRDVFDEVVGILEKNNWEKKEVSLPPPDYKALLPQNGFLIEATVTIQSDRNIVYLILETYPR